MSEREREREREMVDKRSDGGSQIVDFLVFGFLLVMVSSVLVSSVYLYINRKGFKSLSVRSTHLKMQIVQSVAGLLWFVGFVVKIGTFNRGRMRNPNNEMRPLSWCTFWNFSIAILGGFGIWTAIINLRLLRLYSFFILKKDTLKLGSSMTLSFKNDQFKLLMLLYSPFLIFYGFFLIPMGASSVKKIGGDRVCLYTNDIFKWIDILFFVGTMIAMSLLTFSVRRVEDDLGENAAMQKSIRVSLACLASCSIVELLGIDGFCIGRTIVSISVALTIMSYHYLQNAEALKKVIHRDKSVPPELARVFDQILSGSTGIGYDADALEGGGITTMKMKDEGSMSIQNNKNTSATCNDDNDNNTTLRRRVKVLTEEERERREKFNKSLLDLDNE